MFHRYKAINLLINIQLRCMTSLTKAEVKQKQNLLFNEEQKRQRNAIGRIEKIEVKYVSPVEEVILIMNKCISTPMDCAKHISEGLCKVSALAVVNELPWDMHMPLASNCKIEFLNLLKPQHKIVNSAFWRTCSFILGAVINSAFKENVKLHLHSFPVPVVKSGSFMYDVYIELDNWAPTEQEMRALSAQYIKLANQALPIERLQISETLALEIFQHNPIKLEQIPDIARNNDDKITLYRFGDHIDISKGPLVGNSGLIGRCTITAVHKLSSQKNLYRFQGVALPTGILLNHFAYSILERRAKKLNNTSWIFSSDEINNEDENTIAAISNN